MNNNLKRRLELLEEEQRRKAIGIVALRMPHIRNEADQAEWDATLAEARLRAETVVTVRGMCQFAPDQCDCLNRPQALPSRRSR